MKNVNDILDEILKAAQKEMDFDQREIHVIELLRVYLEYRSHDGRSWLSYAECLRLTGRIDESMQAMLTSLGLAPEDKRSAIYGRIGFLCSKYRSPQEAESWYYLGTSSEYCSEGWIWLLRGVNLSVLGRNEEALECFKESRKFEDVDKGEIALNIGLVARTCGNYEEASNNFKEALEIDPDCSAARECLEGLQGISETLDLISQLTINKDSP